MARACQRFIAPPDPQGHPRTVWLLYEWGRSRDVKSVTSFDEGYGGRPEPTWQTTRLPDINIPASEFKRLLDATPL